MSVPSLMTMINLFLWLVTILACAGIGVLAWAVSSKQRNDRAIAFIRRVRG